MIRWRWLRPVKALSPRAQRLVEARIGQLSAELEKHEHRLNDRRPNTGTPGKREVLADAGISKTVAHRAEQLAAASAEVKKALIDGKISITQATRSQRAERIKTRVALPVAKIRQARRHHRPLRLAPAREGTRYTRTSGAGIQQHSLIGRRARLAHAWGDPGGPGAHILVVPSTATTPTGLREQ